MFVRVAVPIPSAQTFIYAIPQTLIPAVAIGKRVLVPFGKRRITGFIVEIPDEANCNQEVKEILDLPDAEPLFRKEDLAFYEWISRYYLHPLGKVLGEILPGGSRCGANDGFAEATRPRPRTSDSPAGKRRSSNSWPAARKGLLWAVCAGPWGEATSMEISIRSRQRVS